MHPYFLTNPKSWYSGNLKYYSTLILTLQKKNINISEDASKSRNHSSISEIAQQNLTAIEKKLQNEIDFINSNLKPNEKFELSQEAKIKIEKFYSYVYNNVPRPRNFEDSEQEHFVI